MSTLVRWVTDFFFRNLGMKLIAIALAAVLFVLTRDEVTKTFEVPLRVVGDPNRVLLTDVPDTVTVKVRGPWTRVNRLQDFDLGTAALDLRTATPGPLDVDQASIVMPSGVLLAEVQYPHVDLRFEPVIERSKRVAPNLVGQPAEDYRVAAVTVTPASWEVRGGRSLVQGITRLSTEAVDISGRTSTTSQSLAIVPPPGNVGLAGAGGVAPRVDVRVEIEAVTQSREVSVPIAVPEDLDPAGRIKKTYQVELSGPLPVFRALDALGKQFPVDGQVVPLEGTTDAGGRVVEIRFGWSDSVPEDALRVGMVVASHFGGGGRVVVGKDTRLSGYLLESALASGLASMGATALLVGPMPTPGIAYLTHSMRASAGVVISASHNPYGDNGIKIFGGDGYKLPDEVEAKLEADIEGDGLDAKRARGDAIGRAFRIEDAPGRYITRLKQAFPPGDDLTGLKVVIDCSHGAAYKIAPTVLEELGATVITRGVSPDGTNINDGVGATHPQALCDAVKEAGADVGVALDGDADRSIFSDENGEIIDGDSIMAMCARDLHQRGELRGGAVVATVMSNLGLERSVAELGISLVRTPVGDRYVVQAMRSGGCNLGGEQSGHLVFLDHSTTGDGVVAALQVLTIMRRTGSPLSRLRRVMTPVPQRLSSFMVPQKLPLERLPKLRRSIRQLERQLGDEGRVLVRYSGTEKKMRVMVECVDEGRIDEYVQHLQGIAVAELGTAG